MIDDLMPKPDMWAQCPTCNVAYVMRRCLSMQEGWVWLWSADCKHKSRPILVNADGPFVQSGEVEQ